MIYVSALYTALYGVIGSKTDDSDDDDTDDSGGIYIFVAIEIKIGINLII